MQESKTSGKFSKIGVNTILNGTIKSQDNVRIDGVLDGDAEISGKLIIGKEAIARGRISCKDAEIEGVFKGRLRATGTLSLKQRSDIKGKIIVQKLIVDLGAIFNASCTMHKKKMEIKN